MAEWHLAPSLVQLRREINAMFPKRDKRSDGALGDAAHSARVSDHNPDYSVPGARYGVVRAIDVDIDDNDATRDLRSMLLSATIGDPRVWYVISNGIIYSRTYGWRARKYTGSNGHWGHLHISIRHTQQAESDISAWFTTAPPRPAPSHNTSLSEAALKHATFHDDMSGTWHDDRAQFLAWAYTIGAITREDLLAPYRGDADWSTTVADAIRAVQHRVTHERPNGRISDKILSEMRADGYTITT